MRVGWVKALLIRFDHLIDPFGNLGSLEHMFCIVAHLRCTVSGHQSSPNFFRWRYNVRTQLYISSLHVLEMRDDGSFIIGCVRCISCAGILPRVGVAD
jgi:hypothetical protein